ncbi:hypothetical protein ACFC51_33690 [Streptomyces sp. NPDC055962]|uniref:hypothetical protein n=1 Tax=Streptomyces sp. NPDC055962 TaxID=3345667 RepID=UPI0035E0E7FF
MTGPARLTSAADIVAGYRTFIGKAHAKGVPVLGGTLLPFRGSFVWTPERQATWTTVNDWIWHSGAFDGVVDFAAATASADDPLSMDPDHTAGTACTPTTRAPARWPMPWTSACCWTGPAGRTRLAGERPAARIRTHT